MITKVEDGLHRWINVVDRILPKMCPKCKKQLQQIRYASDIDRTSARLTSITIEREWYKAECPHCDYVLKSELVKNNL